MYLESYGDGTANGPKNRLGTIIKFVFTTNNEKDFDNKKVDN